MEQSCGRCFCGERMRQRRATSREALITSLGGGLFEFEQRTGQAVIVSFEQAEPFGQFADFGPAFVE